MWKLVGFIFCWMTIVAAHPHSLTRQPVTDTSNTTISYTTTTWRKVHLTDSGRVTGTIVKVVNATSPLSAVTSLVTVMQKICKCAAKHSTAGSSRIAKTTGGATTSVSSPSIFMEKASMMTTNKHTSTRSNLSTITSLVNEKVTTPSTTLSQLITSISKVKKVNITSTRLSGTENLTKLSQPGVMVTKTSIMVVYSKEYGRASEDSKPPYISDMKLGNSDLLTKMYEFFQKVSQILRHSFYKEDYFNSAQTTAATVVSIIIVVLNIV